MQIYIYIYIYIYEFDKENDLTVDCGYGRDGVDPDSEASVELARRIASAPTATLEGIYTHGGHSYGLPAPNTRNHNIIIHLRVLWISPYASRQHSQRCVRIVCSPPLEDLATNATWFIG